MTNSNADSPKIDSAGQVIRKFREEAGLNLEQFADRLGWDKGRLSKYENDHLGLSLPVIESIANALGIRAELIVFECLKHRYPALASGRSKVGRLLDELLEQLMKSPD